MGVGDLKAAQRRAFERGREVAREELGPALSGAAAALEKAAAGFLEARERERREVEEFAVRLACLVAGDLVGRTVAAESHDVRALVRRLLDEVLPDAGPGSVELRGHPDDLVRLDPQLLGGEGAGRVRLVPDPDLEPGCYRVTGEGLEVRSDVNDRLEAVRDRILAELRDGDHA